MAERAITPAEQQVCQDTIQRARAAMRAVDADDQERVDRLCRAVAWAGGNEVTATRLSDGVAASKTP